MIKISAATVIKILADHPPEATGGSAPFGLEPGDDWDSDCTISCGRCIGIEGQAEYLDHLGRLIAEARGTTLEEIAAEVGA
jgi:hypothetical protein